jgi:hypothetical protein
MAENAMKTNEVPVGSMPAPNAGLTIGPDDAVYMTNFGTSSVDGEVLRLAVDPC